MYDLKIIERFIHKISNVDLFIFFNSHLKKIPLLRNDFILFYFIEAQLFS